MKFLFDNIPIAIVIAGICMLMLYPYIGAGLLLAALCFEAKQYTLMVVSFLICVLLQSIMGKHIKPHHVPVKPSRASRRKKKKPARPKAKSSGSTNTKTNTVTTDQSGAGNTAGTDGTTSADETDLAAGYADDPHDTFEYTEEGVKDGRQE